MNATTNYFLSSVILLLHWFGFGFIIFGLGERIKDANRKGFKCALS